jgi:MtN3 and saliva related transmembrane protein
MLRLSITDYLGIIVSILIPIIPLPQIWTIYRTKTAKDLSTCYILLQIVANSVFMTFGILKNDPYIVIPNAMIIFLNLVILSQKYWYRLCTKSKKTKKPEPVKKPESAKKPDHLDNKIVISISESQNSDHKLNYYV